MIELLLKKTFSIKEVSKRKPEQSKKRIRTKEGRLTPLTRAEVDKAIERLENTTDGIHVELFKAARSGFSNEFHQILLNIWNTSIICPIHKKGDKSDCENY
uniref:Uncharacterized protein n=1 Tax=Megaselia scalaris TaxID=36166 RepID=T1GY97_MEGSC